MELSELHDCEKCHDKIVGIAIDKAGNTYCGYCGEKVDYMKFFKVKGIDKERKKLIKLGVKKDSIDKDIKDLEEVGE
jgi:hypothetical protein